ncbi:MAG TPA: peptide-methionine (R)-S-oxide reductase MsrB [Sphingomonas sp.]|uniref:peptide-methionine (R)-S-oxide reductase MsrB n=1 Tax=Sphingomonas sp. TaxID=28214 RepID=UPI002B93EB3F|nr:peptide-methionine (R)-S-oxide reductase MsrB [Sphingomonas sp.]HMI19344.1 peptide-methionine (R)-S-oxide reductase MsrB [Sphingomonas sp.]
MLVSRRALMGAGSGAMATAFLWSAGCSAPTTPEHYEVTLTDAQWRAKLSPAAYDVLRHAGTERPFTSPLLNEHRKGLFTCAGCALPAFASSTKFESGTGWPSFWAPLKNAVVTSDDNSIGMDRTEVHCRRCGGHLGHVFDDGPKPTGLRYCMNGVALGFTPAKA